ncbi:MAG: GH116 family glycosyl-hydrolase [Chthonomonadales bacterium]
MIIGLKWHRAIRPPALSRHGLVAFLLFCGASALAQKSKTPPVPPPPSEYRVVHSERLPMGVPFGGVGCGGFQLMTDGAIGRATFNNNLANPSGDIPGAFAAVWTESEGKTSSRVLKLKSEYGLTGVSKLDYEFRYPEALVQYADPAIPATVSLKAVTPIIPNDLKNSNLPVALFLFKVKNNTKSPMTVSIVLSWENLNGVGIIGKTGPFAYRTGNTIAPLPAREGIFGMMMKGPIAPSPDPPNRLFYNARGNYTLMALASDTAYTYSACSWNALAKQPEWWTEFSKTGMLSGKCNLGVEGSVHPAAAVALKVTLKPGEEKEVPFAFCWYTPRLYVLGGEEYGHLYQKNFDDAWDIGIYALSDRESLTALTEEWMNKILRSSLPDWFQSMLFQSAEMVGRDTILTRDKGTPTPDTGLPIFGVLERSSSIGTSQIGNEWERMIGSHPLAAFYPFSEPVDLNIALEHHSVTGRVPSHSGVWEQIVGGLPEDWIKELDTAGPTIAYTIRVARFYRETGDHLFLDRFYPSVKHALERLIALPADSPVWSVDIRSKDSWPAAMAAAHRLAADMSDKSFGETCKKELDRTKTATADPESARLNFWIARMFGEEANVNSVSPAIGSDPLSIITLVQSGRYAEALTLTRLLFPASRTDAVQPWSDSSLWQLLDAFSGFDYDAPKSALSLLPMTTDKVRAWRAPVFTPKFWGSIEYQPGTAVYKLIFRLDRLMPARSFTLEKKPGLATPMPKPGDAPTPGSASVIVKTVRLPGNSTMVTSSLARTPLLGKVTDVKNGVVTYTFDTPLELVSGQRIEFVVH